MTLSGREMLTPAIRARGFDDSAQCATMPRGFVFRLLAAMR